MATAAQWQRVAHPRRLVESGMRAKDRIQRADREVAGPSSRSSTARSIQRTGFRPSFHIHSPDRQHGAGEYFFNPAKSFFAQLNGGTAYRPIHFFNSSSSKKEVMRIRSLARKGPVGSHRTDSQQGRTGAACNQASSG